MYFVVRMKKKQRNKVQKSNKEYRLCFCLRLAYSIRYGFIALLVLASPIATATTKVITN